MSTGQQQSSSSAASRISSQEYQRLLALPEEQFDEELERLQETDAKLAIKLSRDWRNAQLDAVEREKKSLQQRAEAAEQKAEAAEQRAEFEKQKAEFEKQRAEFEKHRAELEEQRADAAEREKSVAEQKTIKLNRDLRDEKFERKLTAGSKSQRFAFITSEVPVETFPWPEPDVAAVIQAWRAVQGDPRVTDATSHQSENDDTHPALKAALKQIIRSLKLPLSVAVRQTLHGPLLVPDMILGRKETRLSSWYDTRILVELKRANAKAMSEAVAEVTEYLAQSIEHRPESDSENHRVAIASDCRTIQCVWSSDRLARVKRSECLELFPAGWKASNQIPAGFSLLCHALSCPVSLVPMVELSGDLTVVDRTLYSHVGSTVYQITYKLQPLALKLATSKYGRGLIEMEKRIYGIVYQHQEMHPFMVPPPMDPPKVEFGFTTRLGVPFLEWHEDLVAEHDGKWDIIDPLLQPHILHLFDGLAVLHGLGWRHGDIRPANIVRWEESARWIDWCSATELDRYAHGLLIQGYLDPLHPDEPERVWAFGRKWDLLCFGFTTLVLCCDTAEWTPAFANPNTRARFVQKWTTIVHPESKRMAAKAARFLSHLKKMAGEVKVEEYAVLRQFLSVV